MPKKTTKIDESKFKEYILDLLKNKSNKETYDDISKQILERTGETHSPRALRWYYCNKIAPDEKYPALETIKKAHKDKILLEVMDDLNQCRTVARDRLNCFAKLEKEMNLPMKETSEAIETLMETDKVTMEMLFDLGIFTKVLPSIHIESESIEEKNNRVDAVVRKVFSMEVKNKINSIRGGNSNNCHKDIINPQINNKDNQFKGTA